MVFVGHEIDCEGVRFSPDKLSGVDDIPIPKTKGELKRFQGLANYFRDHVQSISILSQPLNLLLPKYNKSQRNHKLVWTDEQKANFIALRDAVSNCPKLFFINDEWEIGLETDASDYGIGGFLFQTKPIVLTKVPIQFVS